MYWQPALIIGERRIEAGPGRRVLPVINPATEESFAQCPQGCREDVDAALAVAREGFDAWRRSTPWQRSEVLRHISALLRNRMEDIAETMTREVGKPLAESRAEITNAYEHFDWCADETRRIYEQRLPGRVHGSSYSIRHEPVGIVLALTAWNFPIGLAARKLSAALAAGCAVILRPAGEAPGTATALVQCCIDGGLPPGAVNLLHGSPETIVEPLMAEPEVRKVSFTGSTKVGQILARQSADTVKKLTMELGGHAPFIVLGDVDVAKVAAVAVAGKFRNAGQVCTSPTRFLIEASVAEEFTARFCEGARKLKLGNGLEPGIQLGPLTTARQRERVEALIADALRHGASVTSGGTRPAALNRGFFLEPAVVFDPDDEAAILHDEPFGPVAVIKPVADLDEALSRANALEFGLASYLFTHSQPAIERVSTEIEAGLLGVNTTVVSMPEAPFGGVKQSGYGREGGAEGVREYLQTRFVHFNSAF
jgi:succinate-semialdehyde dehydrogenase/glutarate-semialdehyde dehydrogenase